MRLRFALAALALTGAGALSVSACSDILGIQSGILEDAGVTDATTPDDVTSHGDGSVGGPDGAFQDAPATDAGVDAPPSCASTCSGCCEADGGCVTAPADAGVCGLGGAACATCGASSPCTDGICFGCSKPTVILASASKDTGVSGFGTSVALSGSTLLVGASGTKSAYVFAQSGSSWVWQASLYPLNTATAFGDSVAISGTVAMVSGIIGGAPTVWVFNQVGSSWFQGPTITLPTTDAAPLYSAPVALDGNVAVIGSGDGLTAVAVYVKVGSTWSLQGTLRAGEAVPNLYVGQQVALSAGTAMVSVFSINSQGSQARWADVFAADAGAWGQQGTLAPASLAATNDSHFQYSFASVGDSAYLAATTGMYLYTRSGGTWTQQGATNDGGVIFGGTDEGFGSALGVTPGALLVGDTVGYGSGQAYFYAQAGTQWLKQELTLTNVGGGGPPVVGDAVAKSGPNVAVGLPGSYQNVPGGAVLVYTCSP